MPTSYLIADGDRAFREATAIGLRLDGHPTTCASSAEEAIAQLALGNVGCCVIDAHLAGAELLVEAALRSGLRTVLTGPYPELLAGVGRRHPLAELLPKPFGATELAGRTH
ncbi:MAG: hypothetical protein QM767_24295 [Anaeromyxobacter sp.]